MLDKAVTIRQLVQIARALGPHGNGHACAGSPDHNSEYTRGQAELIADAAGLQDHKAAITELITEGTLSAGCAHGK